MIGNDVIDLDLARSESDIFRPGYRSKVLTEAEIWMIDKSSEPEILFWLLWSMKESAYKIFNRETGIRAFNPTKFECEIDVREMSGRVTHLTGIYFTKSCLSSDCIYTIACKSKEFMNEVTDINPLFINRQANLPIAIVDGKSYIASTSHHGKFSKAVYLPYSQF